MPLLLGGEPLVPEVTAREQRRRSRHLRAHAGDPTDFTPRHVGVEDFAALQPLLEQSDFVVLESNHDINMLKNGFYPYPLKQRILSNRGHLSNEACAKELVNLVEKGTLRLMLGHLSEENNTVPLAMSTSVDLLTSNGMKYKSDYSLDVAPSVSTTKAIIF